MLIGDGFAIAAFLQKRSNPVPAPAASKAARTAPAKPTVSKSVFVEIPKFVVTIPASSTGDGGSVYLQLALSFLTENKRAAEDFSKLIPVIKAGIISDIMSSSMSLSGKPMKLKHKIATDSLDVANSVVMQSDSKIRTRPFFGAYITDFITQ